MAENFPIITKNINSQNCESDYAILATFLSPHENQKKKKKEREKFKSNRVKKIMKIPGGVVSHQNISHETMGRGFFLQC